MTLSKHEAAYRKDMRNYVTQAEARAIPNVGHRFKRHRSKLGWPRQTDVTSLLADTGYTVPITRVITCRLEYKRYTAGQANARYREIHGEPYDGRYVSGRYWVYWRKG